MFSTLKHRVFPAFTKLWTVFWTIVRALVYFCAFISGLSILFMIIVTSLDIILRAVGHPFVGSYDLVRCAGAVAIAGALPYTSAVKGHVAIEYFFLKLNRPGRVVVDTLSRLVVMGLFGGFMWQCVRYGASMKRNNLVSLTLELPLFWIPYVIAVACLLTLLVVLYNLLHPGREMIKP